MHIYLGRGGGRGGGGGGAGTFWLIKTGLHKIATLLPLLGDTSEQVFVLSAIWV